MVVDTSVVVAILTGEPEGVRLAQVLDEATSLQISVASILEISMVIESRYGDAARKTFEAWLESTPVEAIVVNRTQVEAARDGFRRFGKGRHPAALNFGDCFSYGLARTLGESLLFRGNDFVKTDVQVAPGSAIPPPVMIDG